MAKIIRQKKLFKPIYEFEGNVTFSYRTKENATEALKEFKSSIFATNNYVVLDLVDAIEFDVESKMGLN